MKYRRFLVILFSLFFGCTFLSAQELKLKSVLDYMEVASYEIYIEYRYDIDSPVYVSDELTKGIFMTKEDGGGLSVYYYPRGDNIVIANESTKWPAVLRKIEPQAILAMRINFDSFLQNLDSSITAFTFTICDICFILEADKAQHFLLPTELYKVFENKNRKVLRSNPILFTKALNETWQIDYMVNAKAAVSAYVFRETPALNKRFKFDSEKIMEYYRSDEAVHDLEEKLKANGGT